MGTFVKTFIITLLICFCYVIYLVVGKESFSEYLTVNETTIDKVVKPKNVEKKASMVSFYLINSNNQPVLTKRESDVNSLEIAVLELLKGSTRKERLEGKYTEIPSKTRLISIKDENNKILINLSKEFEEGGGAQSIQARLLQLTKTINLYSDKKPIYLYIEDKKAEYLGGEGVYIEQPLNEEKLNF